MKIKLVENETSVKTRCLEDAKKKNAQKEIQARNYEKEILKVKEKIKDTSKQKTDALAKADSDALMKAIKEKNELEETLSELEEAKTITETRPLADEEETVRIMEEIKAEGEAIMQKKTKELEAIVMDALKTEAELEAIQTDYNNAIEEVKRLLNSGLYQSITMPQITRVDHLAKQLRNE